MIVLNAEEAERVRGFSPIIDGRALDPVLLRDGRLILGEECLADPAHVDVREFLAALPREELTTLPLFTSFDEPPPAEETAIADLPVRGE